MRALVCLFISCAPRLLLQGLQLATSPSWCVPPCMTGTRWSASVAGLIPHQWHMGASLSRSALAVLNAFVFLSSIGQEHRSRSRALAPTAEMHRCSCSHLSCVSVWYVPPLFEPLCSGSLSNLGGQPFTICAVWKRCLLT